ncbi:ATP-binding protein [Candidatus Woesearchaeota archaeon]|nr:ATP-binding protein [Candidatus Woesearchaeota archaeon]
MVTKSDFVMEWDKALGFKGDPFPEKVLLPINTFLVNRKDEKEKLNWFFIKGYYFGTIIGEPGVGKTVVLKWLEDRLSKYNRLHAVYINAAVFKEQINIPQRMLLPLLSFQERLFTQPHKKLGSIEIMNLLKKKLQHKAVALLIDNAQHLTEKNLELIKGMKRDGFRMQIIIASNPKEYGKSRLSEIGPDELNITLRRLNFEEVKEMLAKRIEAFGGRGLYPFSENDLKEMYDKADKNPKEFLKLCRDEAIKILIHKREALEKQAYAQASEIRESKPLKTSIKKTFPSDNKMDVKIRKANEKDMREEEKEQKGKLIRIKFAFGKRDEHEKSMKPAMQPMQSSQPKQSLAIKKDDKRAIYSDEHKEALVNQLSSTSPRRKTVEDDKKKNEKYVSETDKLLRELADEFEVK